MAFWTPEWCLVSHPNNLLQFHVNPFHFFRMEVHNESIISLTTCVYANSRRCVFINHDRWYRSYHLITQLILHNDVNSPVIHFFCCVDTSDCNRCIYRLKIVKQSMDFFLCTAKAFSVGRNFHLFYHYMHVNNGTSSDAYFFPFVASCVKHFFCSRPLIYVEVTAILKNSIITDYTLLNKL